jgi:NDP-sugar pyrophosphorylase family protein|tara:strand:- start:3503 stop:4204 length:702 start_codon:yes stop_codon:yes gene_type:complete
MKAIILAGGLGTRLRPLTYDTPKPLLPIKDKPLIEWTILNLKKHGITDIILSIGYKAEMIKDYFKSGEEFGVNISYNVEEELLGTGGAVKDILNKFGINEPFALVWGDNLADHSFGGMRNLFDEKEADLVMTLTSREDVENFGVAKLSENRIIGFVEKPKREEAPSNLINAGAFIVNPKILDILPEGVSNIERECFQKVATEEGKVFAFEHKGYWYPTDTLEKYNFANEEFRG